MDAITKINTVVFDKTGTLTKGVFEVQQVHVREGFTEEEVVRTIASVESRSNHPIAKAVEQYAKSRQISIRRDVEVSELAGYGLKTLVDGQEVLVGNTRLLEKYGISFPSELTGVSETLVVCAVNGEYVGHLLLADTVKEDAKEAVAALKKLNIDNIQILSGDKQTIVSKLAGYLGVDEAYGDLLPEDKVAHVEALKSDPGRRVAFVGDGINDAPVLALSDVGVAMGGLGSDAAIEIADVVLQTDQPGRLAMAIRIREGDPPDHLAEHHAGFRGKTDRVGTGSRGTRHHVGGRVCRCRGSLVGNFECDKNTETSKIECYGREGIFGKTGKAGDQADGHAAVDSEGDDPLYPGV